jgi:hypothetical protein
MRSDPWRGVHVPGCPQELRTWPMGNKGQVVYLIHRRYVTLLLLDLIWAGP